MHDIWFDGWGYWVKKNRFRWLVDAMRYAALKAPYL